MNKAKKICGIATKSGTVRSFMVPNLKYMSENGWQCFCIADGMFSAEELGKIQHIPMGIKWGYVGPFEVLRNIYRFYKIFKQEKFDIIQYATFNASLPASIAGWLAHVPVRINLQWGMSYLSDKGFVHYFKRFVEKITCLCSTSIQPDSNGNLQLSVADGLYPACKGCVIYNGSASGVDLKKYNYEKKQEWKNELYKQYNLYPFKRVFGYVGRVTKEKGIDELLEAFMDLKRDDVFLWVIGPLQESNTLNQHLYKKAQEKKNILFTGSVQNAAKFYAAMDFMILPSYHEGFGMTVVESAGLGTPSIITNIKGPTDLIKDGLNGIVCEVKSVESLKIAMQIGMEMNNDKYTKMSKAAYRIVSESFDSDTFKKKFLENREMLYSKSSRK